MSVAKHGPSSSKDDWKVIIGLAAVLVAVFGCMVGVAYSVEVDEANQLALFEERYGFAEGTEYPATIIGFREIQTDLNGGFFLFSGEISGGKEIIVVLVSVTIGDFDYILNVASTDIAFSQVPGTLQSTVEFDLWDASSVYDDTTVNSLLKREFKGITITLSPEEYDELIENMP